MYKTLHLFFATLLLGMTLYNFVILVSQQKSAALRALTLQISLLMDWGVSLTLVILFISGMLLTPRFHWTFNTPWIEAAYLLLALTTLLWITLAFIKHSLVKRHSLAKTRTLQGINATIAVILVLIIKDAVTKLTWIHW